MTTGQVLKAVKQMKETDEYDSDAIDSKGRHWSSYNKGFNNYNKLWERKQQNYTSYTISLIKLYYNLIN